MAKGSRVVTCRLPPDLEAEVAAYLQHRNEVTRGEPWGISQLLVVALREKLAHAARSRRSRRPAVSTAAVVAAETPKEN